MLLVKNARGVTRAVFHIDLAISADFSHPRIKHLGADGYVVFTKYNRIVEWHDQVRKEADKRPLAIPVMVVRHPQDICQIPNLVSFVAIAPSACAQSLERPEILACSDFRVFIQVVSACVFFHTVLLG